MLYEGIVVRDMEGEKKNIVRLTACDQLVNRFRRCPYAEVEHFISLALKKDGECFQLDVACLSFDRCTDGSLAAQRRLYDDIG